MELTKKNNLPTFLLDCRFQCPKDLILRKLSPEPTGGKPSTKREGNRRSDCVAYKDTGETPPQPEEKTSADAKDAAGQKQNITKRKKKGICHPAPRAPLYHPLLRDGDKIDNWKKAR